jgi:uncharacterized protein YegP (UPF0339 family)
MPAKFLVSKNKANKYSFSLKATTGKVIISSETYATKKEALSAIKSIQKAAVSAVIDDPEAKTEAAAKKTAVKAPGARGRGRPPKAAAEKKPAVKKPAAKKIVVKKPVIKKAAVKKAVEKKIETPDTSSIF